MDDFNINSLQESRNEYCSRLITLLTPCIIDGVKSIFEESWKLCSENDEKAKYLMTFQNFLSMSTLVAHYIQVIQEIY